LIEGKFQSENLSQCTYPHQKAVHWCKAHTSLPEH